jgi:hypothetical protein
MPKAQGFLNQTTMPNKKASQKGGLRIFVLEHRTPTELSSLGQLPMDKVDQLRFYSNPMTKNI